MTSLSKIKDAGQITTSDNYLNLQINWDDGHQSEYDINNLLDKVYRKPSEAIQFELWNGKKLQNIPRLDSKTLKFFDFARLFANFGVVIIDNVEASSEETEKLCKKLVPIHDTFFGDFWTFSNQSDKDPSHEDTAYGNDDIGPHTDGTYFDQSPGIQVFHCLRPAEVGGDTVLVDAFHCAQLLKQNSPQSFEILKNFKIDHHYLEGNPPGSSIHSLSSQKSVIEVNADGQVTQVRFNPYDRAPFRFLSTNENIDRAKEVIEFYNAYEEFSKLCHDVNNYVRVSLQPGSVIFIDNFRVLHSRTSFKGYRQMCGCYLSRDNFFAKARPFLLAQK